MASDYDWLRAPSRAMLDATSTLSDRLLQEGFRRAAKAVAEKLELPAHFIEILLLVEDKRFLYHPGIDPIAVVRAFLSNCLREGTVQGGSTLTQQIFSARSRANGTYRRTYRFKVTQAAWAVHATATREKADVLREYLETVYFGRTYYGLVRAASHYCNESPRDLSPASSFFLIERIARPNVVSRLRIVRLVQRQLIARYLSNDSNCPKELATIYEQQFGCGKVVASCLEKYLKKPVVPTRMFSVDAWSEL